MFFNLLFQVWGKNLNIEKILRTENKTCLTQNIVLINIKECIKIKKPKILFVRRKLQQTPN